jgi:hypothetical protein
MAGTHALDLVAPRSVASPISAWLKARGPSPYAIALKTSGKTGRLDQGKAGARITLV